MHVKELMTVLCVSINTAASTCPTTCPGCLVMPPTRHQPVGTPAQGQREEAVCGSQAPVGGGELAQLARLVCGERTLKPQLGQGEGRDGHLYPTMKGVQRRASSGHSCFPLVQKWAPVPQTGDKQPKVSGRRMSVWFLAK